MSYFQVMLEGENFFIEFDGKEELLGFTTTRWVKASNEEQAELKAVELIKNDTHLQNLLRNPENELPSPMIYLSEMCKVNWFTYVRRKPGAGYSFYPMGQE
ncbi:hypothetical protein [Gayadomonas joobiniege]|uniref:hypothetical protein n=1 Tax=Gayadomonas joobiniege TaxID=1234606 RepID=UPI0003601D2D|nr:hypothetical protein [Gayadomonas joobiniege]